ncbi:lipoate--protein ligase family protein [Cohnella yongneupensis]|uniref:Biotin/lipoate A/B protein ligase family protein n=1 Tax=Cohnella yongneupensis TaxID=425006 RepID=A0ABW0R1Q3_9BACL
MNNGSFEWAKGMIVLDRTQAEIAPVGDSFARDELLCQRVGEGRPPVCHLWRHPRAFVLGAKDSRLPGAPEAVRWLEREGYEPIVRGSGGAAVPLDDGVVNVSLIMPLSGTYAYGFRDDFTRMVELIKRTMAGYGLVVRHGEVEGSYCPGDYDLHIDGFKFCGIAQRRQVKAMIVSAFVNVAGSGDARAALVRRFYDVAGIGAEAGDYPDVIAGRTTSLEERGFAWGEGGLDASEGSDGLVSSFVGAIVRTLSYGDPVTALAVSPPHELPDASAIAEMRERLAIRYPIPR